MKPGDTPAQTYGLLVSVIQGFRLGSTGVTRMTSPSAFAAPGSACTAWRMGWLAGARAFAYLSPAIEHTQQRAFFDLLAVCELACPELELTFAVPNGGLRHKPVGAKLKAEGVKPGVPDVLVPLSAGSRSGLFIEMKSDTGTVSAVQRSRHVRLAAVGATVVVCRSWAQAAEAVLAHMAVRLGVLGEVSAEPTSPNP